MARRTLYPCVKIMDLEKATDFEKTIAARALFKI
jgi:hypothetical protein